MRIENNLNCRISKAYNFFPPYELVQLDAITCEGEPYSFGDLQLTQEGTYRDTFKMSNNCDSIVIVDLELEQSQEHEITARVFLVNNMK